jgi:hypothetical protein
MAARPTPVALLFALISCLFISPAWSQEHDMSNNMEGMPGMDHGNYDYTC